MTKLLNSLCLVFIVNAVSFGQTNRSVSIGIDLFRSLPTYFNSGYTLEPSLIYTANEQYSIDFSFGTTSIARTHIYENIDYRNKGFYFKLGVRKALVKNLYLGASFGHSSFVESGNITFWQGAKAGNYIHHVSQSNQLLFFEPSLSYQWNLSERFSILPQLRMDFILSEFNNSAFPVYSAPGIGWLQLFQDSDQGVNRVVVAQNVRLVYKLFK